MLVQKVPAACSSPEVGLGPEGPGQRSPGLHRLALDRADASRGSLTAAARSRPAQRSASWLDHAAMRRSGSATFESGSTVADRLPDGRVQPSPFDRVHFDWPVGECKSCHLRYCQNRAGRTPRRTWVGSTCSHPARLDRRVRPVRQPRPARRTRRRTGHRATHRLVRPPVERPRRRDLQPTPGRPPFRGDLLDGPGLAEHRPDPPTPAARPRP